MEIRNLEIIPRGVSPVINVSQYDVGRTFKFLLFDGDLAYTIPSGAVVRVEGIKKDKTGFSYECEYSGNEVTVEVTRQMTVFSGEVKSELRIVYDEVNIGTLNFVLKVEDSPINDEIDISETEIPAIIELATEQMEAAAESASQAASSAESASDSEEQSEAWATGKINGVDVPATAPQYENNSKFFAEKAAELTTKMPYVGNNGNWFIFDIQNNQYVDSGYPSRGAQGDTGNGIFSIVKTGTSGLVDTYTITFTDGTTTTFTVTNGQDGTGTGDMLKADYDSNDAVENAGGIAAFVADQISVKQNSTDNNLETTDKTIVGAINELNTGKQNSTDNNLDTTDKTIVGAINELKTESDTHLKKYASDNSQWDSSPTKSSDKPVTSNGIFLAITEYQSHNVPRLQSKDITGYFNDGTFYKRLAGTDGFSLFEDIYVGDYINMSRAISAPGQSDTGGTGITIIGLDTKMCDGDTNNTAINYHHAICTVGRGEDGIQHFGRKRMNASDSTVGGYLGSEMHTTTFGAVATTGSTLSTATINEQLFAEFGSHLKTTRELLTNSVDNTRNNRKGTNTGASSDVDWNWTTCQAVLMSEIEVYGSIVWSSSGYDTGINSKQMPYFIFSKKAINNRVGGYWLKDVMSSSEFCACYISGRAYGNRAAGSLGIRPRFILA